MTGTDVSIDSRLREATLLQLAAPIDAEWIPAPSAGGLPIINPSTGAYGIDDRPELNYINLVGLSR